MQAWCVEAVAELSEFFMSSLNVCTWKICENIFLAKANVSLMKMFVEVKRTNFSKERGDV